MRKKFAQQACIVVPGKLCKQVSMLKLLIVIDLLCTLPLISIVAHRALDFLTWPILPLFCWFLLVFSVEFAGMLLTVFFAEYS